MRARSASSFVRAAVVTLTTVALLVCAAVTAYAQSPSPEGTVAPPKPGPPASYYAAYGLIAIAGLTLLAILAGYLYQAPGFRRSSRTAG